MMDISLNICGASGKMYLFKHCLTGVNSTKFLLERKYVIEKTHYPRCLGN